MHKINKFMLVTTLAAAVFATGCASWSRGDSERSAGRIVDDNRITGMVEKNLKQEPVYKFSDVDVKTFNGVVQLSGFVTTDDQKQRAGNIAQQIPGVSRVVNSIALKPESTTPTGRQNTRTNDFNDATEPRINNP